MTLFFAYNEKSDEDVIALKKELNLSSRIFVVRGNLAQRHGIVDKEGNGTFPTTLVVNHQGRIEEIYSEEGDPQVFSFVLEEQLSALDESAPEDLLQKIDRLEASPAAQQITTPAVEKTPQSSPVESKSKKRKRKQKL